MLLALSAANEVTQERTLPASAPPVLFFVPVGVSHLDLMRINVAALTKSYPRLEFFFAHYDGASGRSRYQEEEWYRRSVGSHSCAYPGKYNPVATTVSPI